MKKKFNPFTRKLQYINDSVVSAIPVFVQAIEPVLSSNQSLGIWEDTTSGMKLMIYKDSTGGQTLVELS